MADSDDKAVRSICLPTFDREQKNFQIWWMRFHAYGTVHGFAQSIQMTPDPDLPCTEYKVLDTATTNGALAAKAVKMNAVAMCNFTMAFTTEALIGVIYTSMTDEWPTGKTNTV
eukprot:15093039-Ditylum_brightwellii.AAC.1